MQSGDSVELEEHMAVAGCTDAELGWGGSRITRKEAFWGQLQAWYRRKM